MEDERRQGRRYEVWFPMRLGNEGDGPVLAMSQNVSRSGVLVASAESLAPGAEVTVRFRVPPDQEEHEVSGRVIRAQPNDRDPDGLWPYLVAVAFDGSMPELEPLLGASADRQSRPG